MPTRAIISHFPRTQQAVPDFLVCDKCGTSKPIKAFGWTKKHRSAACVSCQRKHANIVLRNKVLAAYGNRCACCGESNTEFLTIDHIGNWGHQDKGARSRRSQVLYQLVREGFPKEKHRILCYNCNCAIGLYGFCPHRPNDKCKPAHVVAKEYRSRIAIIRAAVEARKAQAGAQCQTEF